MSCQKCTYICHSWKDVKMAAVLLSLFYSFITASTSTLIFKGLGTPSKKKLADLRTLSQLSLPLPPLGPIRTNFNWDIFEDCYPSPPFVQLGQYTFEILVDQPPTHHQKTVFSLYMSIMVLWWPDKGQRMVRWQSGGCSSSPKIQIFKSVMKLRIRKSSWTPPLP